MNSWELVVSLHKAGWRHCWVRKDEKPEAYDPACENPALTWYIGFVLMGAFSVVGSYLWFGFRSIMVLLSFHQPAPTTTTRKRRKRRKRRRRGGGGGEAGGGRNTQRAWNDCIIKIDTEYKEGGSH